MSIITWIINIILLFKKSKSKNETPQYIRIRKNNKFYDALEKGETKISDTIRKEKQDEIKKLKI